MSKIQFRFLRKIKVMAWKIKKWELRVRKKTGIPMNVKNAKRFL